VIVAEGQVEVWANVISALRRCVLPYLGDSRLLAQAEDFWLQAQVMVGETAQQAQRHQAAQLEEQTKILNEIRTALITTFDMNGLMDTLARELPRLGIPGCYLSLYENPEQPAELSRLMLAYDLQRGRLDPSTGSGQALEAEKQSFPSSDLVPQGMLPQDRRYNLVAEALYFREEQLGFVLFETGSREGSVSGMLRKGLIYGMLREEISSALQGARLVQRVQKHSAETTRQQYVLDMFMRNVPDRIYFKDIHSNITQTNRAFAIKIGITDPRELIGKSDFDLYPLEQAEIKYQQEQEIIKTGQPVLDLEEPDGVDRWALTTKMPLRDENGAIIGTFGISSDITELVKARQAAETALKEADKARSIAEKEKAKAEVAKNEAQKAHHEAEIANQTLAAQIWQTTGQALLNEKMRGEQDISMLANNVIQQLCKYMGVDNGAIYVLEEKVLQLTGTYAYRRKSLVQQYQVGEGQVGQAVIEKEIIFKEIPDDYIALSLRQGKVLPKYSLVAPVVYNQQASGVVMLESMTEFSLPQRNFLEKAIESVAIAFMTAQARARVDELFSQTRQQAEELQAQEEELRATNEELEAQTESLRASENRLKTNQAALEAANADLEEKTHILQEQQTALDYQNRTLREAQQELERKAEELTVTNKYKSEFLANMSHELRTPLNSLLILSRMLANNDEGNLTPNQTESAEIIYTSGAELLELINDILDLSKVEAGHMSFVFEPMLLTSLAQSMRSQFEHVAQQKNLGFEISLAAGLPESITTDQQRAEQVIKNMLSNAFKFTESGKVQLIIEPDGKMVAIRVRDSGIGMTPEQQQRVFEAFQQADGSTSRKYGGTGLGLTISRELTAKLGGRIGLESEPGKGSVFTLYLPLHHSEGATESAPVPAPVSKTVTQAFGAPALSRVEVSAPIAPTSLRETNAVELFDPRAKTSAAVYTSKPTPFVDDDRDKIQKGDRVLLVIEDDAKFAKVLLGYAHKKDFKCVLAGDGESGLKLAALHPPDAILLDLKLPGMSGWDVLDTLKGDPGLRHIPVHILSADNQTMDAYKRGALGFLSKPISQDQLDGVFSTIGEFLSRDIKSLLIVEDDTGLRHSVRQLLGGSDVKISEAASGAATLALLRKTRFDCMILDLTLPDMTGFELLSKINQDETVSKCPVIVYTGKALTEEENAKLLKYASSVIIKGVKSPERLLDETALFLHRVVADMPAEKQHTIRLLHDRDAVFSGKHVLVVDDNMRNAFALSRLLSDRNLRVTIARSGIKALEMLETIADIDLVLMDIMMPEMDGYETMQRIRAQYKFKNLPVLALTAKAMKGDLEKCIAAGANDYLSKPIDADRLFSMLRVWLYR
jgi:PAS domain S-box-containing protein